MTNLDVMPVGQAPGASTVVRRRPWAIILGAVGLIAGIVLAIVGIAEAVDTHGAIEGDAVARGVVSEQSQPVTFEVADGAERDYTVYLTFEKGNYVNRQLEEDASVRTTSCDAALPDGRTHSFRGSRQGVSQRIERAATVGHFSTSPGRVRLHCAYERGLRRSRYRRFDTVDYVVTPGKPTVAGGGTLLIVGGVFGAIGAGFLLGWGLLGRRVPL